MSDARGANDEAWGLAGRSEIGRERALLTATGVHVRRGRRDVLRGIDLAIGAGEMIAVLGPNGAGKSTLLATLGGTLSPRRGRVERSGKVATVMQSAGLAGCSARANVELAVAWWGVPRRRRRQRALDALERMHATHLADRRAQALSGGEQRRIHLARALAVAPDVLLLDEPFDGLDPHTHAALRDDLTTALRAGGGAVVTVLHDRVDAWAMADRAVVLVDGRVRADGPPQALLDAPPTADVARFLGYDGQIATPRGVLLTRDRHVRLDAGGDLLGRVVGVVAVEDGLRVRVELDAGTLWSRAHPGQVTVGDTVPLSVRGGAVFPHEHG